VECKLRCVKFRRVSDPGRALLAAFRVGGMGGPTTSLGAPGSAGDNPERAGDKSGSTSTTVEQSGKNNIVFRNAAGTAGNHSYYLSFNDF
jgi:hypothetical protein